MSFKFFKKYSLRIKNKKNFVLVSFIIKKNNLNFPLRIIILLVITKIVLKIMIIIIMIIIIIILEIIMIIIIIVIIITIIKNK